MKRGFWIALTFVGVMACVAFSIQRMEAQSTGPFKMYSKGPMKLSVSTRSGQVLTSLEIPAGVTLSISAPNAFTANGGALDGKQMPAMFTGDISIMTRPSRDLSDGPLRDQMLASPLRLDVQDAVVAVTQGQ